jgi:signal transduction histidine kinase
LTNSLSLLRHAKKGISALANRAKFTKTIKSRVCFKELLQEAIAKVTPDADNVGARINLSCPKELEIYVDRDKMLRVFLNFLENSVWFLERDNKPGQKEIELTVRQVESQLSIICRDNGPGIAPYEVKKIFDYLFTTKGDRGMGFGLAIARRIVRAHGGEISARSQWGLWTEIIVSLPLNDDNQPTHG